MIKRLIAHHFFPRLMTRTAAMLAVALILGSLVPLVSFAQGSTVPDATIPINTMWTLVAAFLVFFMQAGFLALEAGSARPRETVNLLLEDFIDVAFTGVIFWAIGFGVMFGDGNAFFGTTGFFLSGMSVTGTFVMGGVDTGVPLLAFWLFQFAFASTAATIASGAMIGRTSFWGNLAYTALVGGLVYPMVGHWLWHPQGWLAVGGAWDFAGSTVVHTTGAVVAIMGVIFLGPRLGRKFAKDGGGPMPFHNYSLITLGTLILWFGWFGFNPGSTLSGMNWQATALIAFNTNLAGCTGALAAMFFAYLQNRKWDLVFACNGCLAGLVAITAPCAFVSPTSAAIIGVVGGILVVLVTQAEEALGLDDVVAAFPVHGANGIWGTLAVGLFADPAFQPTVADGLKFTGLFVGGGADQLVKQLVASGAAVGFGVAVWLVFFGALKMLGILRVSAEVEIRGIDVTLHGSLPYPGMVMDTNDGTPTSVDGAMKAARVATAAGD
jgi:Amt family ammonium transporter